MDGQVKQWAVAEAMAADIRSGVTPVGSRVPTHTQTAQRYGVSVSTARLAAGILRGLGVLAPRPGGGMIVAALPPEPLRRPSPAGERALAEVAALRAEVAELRERVDRLDGA